MKNGHTLILRDKSLSYLKDGEIRQYRDVQELRESTCLEKRAEFSLIIDSKSIHYVLDTLPDIPFFDRLQLTKNRLKKHGQGSQLQGLVKYTSRQVGFAGVSQNAFIENALDELLKLRLPIRNITLLPLELIRFSPSELSWSLLIYQNEDQDMRHILVQNGQLVFTRAIETTKASVSDIESTLKYAERFNLDTQEGKIIQVGKLQESLPDTILGLGVQKISPEKSVEEGVFEKLAFQRKPILSLTPNPFLKVFLKFKAPRWFRRFSFGYGATALCLSVLLYVNAVMNLKQLSQMEEELSGIRVQLSHFEKNRKDLVEKVDFIKAYESEVSQGDDPLVILRKIAIRKPVTLILSKIDWEKPRNQRGELRVTVMNLAQGMSTKKHRKTYRQFYKSLNQTFPNQVVERLKQRANTPRKLLIAERGYKEGHYMPLPQTYSIRGRKI